MEFARINGATLHYRHRHLAGRPTIVFVNSLGTDLRIWNGIEHLLAGDYGFLFYDKRGHGLSELGEAPHTIETHAADLAGLLDHLGIAGTVICGLSIGGVIAQCLYQVQPRLIEGMILCDTAAKIGTDETWNDRIKATRSEGIESFADGVMEKWFTPDFHRNCAEKLAGYRTMLTRQSPAGYAAACTAIRDADYRAAAALIGVPTLCVVGDQDGSTPPEMVESFAHSIPGAGCEVIAGAGHIPCVEQPEKLAKLIRRFVGNDMQRRRA
ncbi:3-oxoadipate enol-lactonase [Mesorhizobium sp. M9A.F.Ca.ET.002.03.1.2]|uniref:3-oxoadipate enol-lactonase n=1 Tax=Mesorhizobium sp. M9A.F.Ca.ET.002.03.1.2 TaxID=2493668 RepID=UPI000F7554A0|nr:3-oxoadipate enol-lactonase [Mesorhizobium sp. M9A.F.Ca.ET.002.03.1.2]AZO01026.1 3-oxoadipate enol-lactonase [Mesorhizobium sp. M9A.F.Ca.ET.002.03.1.2]